MTLHNYFAKKKVLITGGSSGIGKALAVALADMDAEVAIVAREPEALNEAAAELAEIGQPVHSFVCDLARPDQTTALSAQVLKDFGGPDILINNAGFAIYRTFEQLSRQEVEDLMEVNLTACLRLTSAFLPKFLERRNGVIVNIASIAGRLALTPNSVYCTAKHGMVAWSECLSYELARFNIRVCVICPGRVLTKFFDHETFQTRATRSETSYTIPLSRVVEGTLRAVARERFLTYIPNSLGFLAWAKRACPFVVEPLYRRLMLQRIESLYGKRDS